MASLRQTAAGTYVVCFRFSGTHYQRSLKTKTKAEAKDGLKKVESQLYRLGLGELTIPHDVDPADFIVSGKITPDPEPQSNTQPSSFDELRASYLADQRGRKAETTIATERTHLKNLHRTLGDWVEEPLNKISARHLDAALHSRRQQVSGTTVMKERQTLLLFLTWAYRHNHLSSLPTEKLVTFETNGEEDRFRTRAEIESLLSRGGLTTTDAAEHWKNLYLDEKQISEILPLVQRHARHDFILPMVALAAFTGMRRGEILRTRWANVDLKNDVVTAFSKKQSRQKSETRREIPIHPELKAILNEYQTLRPRGQHVICSGQSLAPLTKDMAQHHLHQSLRQTRWEVELPHVSANHKSDEKPPTKVVTHRSFVKVYPSIVQLTGGGWPAIVAARILYWCEVPEGNLLPRSRPQPDPDCPAWLSHGIHQIAQEIGVDEKRPRKVERAIKRLCELDLVTWEEVCPADYIDRDFGEVVDWTYALRPSPELLDAKDAHWMTVPIAYFSEEKLSPNPAILLAYLYRRCVLNYKKLRVSVRGIKVFAASRRRISVETGLTEQQVRTALDVLTDSQFVKIENRLFQGHPTNHIHFTKRGAKMCKTYRS